MLLMHANSREDIKEANAGWYSCSSWFKKYYNRTHIVWRE
jgi:hypothetical protein